MIEKVKSDVHRLLLFLIMEKTFSIDFAKIELFYIFQSKRSLSIRPLLLLYHFPIFENKIS